MDYLRLYTFARAHGTVIAGTTFTQLVRMKVFLFLGLFAVALLALSSFRLSAVLGPETGESMNSCC